MARSPASASSSDSTASGTIRAPSGERCWIGGGIAPGSIANARAFWSCSSMRAVPPERVRLLARDDLAAKCANEIDVLPGGPMLELTDEVGGADRAIAPRKRPHRVERALHVSVGRGV